MALERFPTYLSDGNGDGGMTIKDIARESGYAVGTVSRVLNGHPNVSPAARAKILEVVGRHGFRPNANARRLKQQASNSIAVVVKGTNNLLFAGVVETVQTLLEGRGYSVIVSYQGEDGDEVRAAQNLRAERKPLGVLFLGGSRENFRRGAEGIGCPCVLLTVPAGDLGVENLSSVAIDDAAGARTAMEYLLDAGHRAVGIIGGESGPMPDAATVGNISQMRFAGCRQALEARGLAADRDTCSVTAPYSLQGGYQGAVSLLERRPDLTAIFAMSDVMAIGAMRAIRDRGLRVPEDISVMGYDGIELGRYCIPKLTTIRQDGGAMARRGAEILLDCLEKQTSCVHEVIPFQLWEGESVARR